MEQEKKTLDMAMFDGLRAAYKAESDAQEELDKLEKEIDARVEFNKLRELRKEVSNCSGKRNDIQVNVQEALVNILHISYSRAYVITNGVRDGLTEHQLTYIACGKFSSDKAIAIECALANGLPEEYVEKCADMPFTDGQLRQVLDAKNWFEINSFDIAFDSCRMLYKKVQATHDSISPLTEKELAVYADPSLSENLMWVLKMALIAGIPSEEVAKYAKSNMPCKEAHNAFMKYLWEHEKSVA